MTRMNFLPFLKLRHKSLCTIPRYLKHISMLCSQQAEIATKEKEKSFVSLITCSEGPASFLYQIYKEWNVSHSSIYNTAYHQMRLLQHPLIWLFNEPIHCTQWYSGLGMIVGFYYGSTVFSSFLYIFCTLFSRLPFVLCKKFLNS